MRNYRGRVVVITGAGSGIGQALAVQLADHGARLALSDINEESVAATAAECARRGADVAHFGLDVSDRDAVYAHAATVAEHFGVVHLVINNAGVAVHAGIQDMSDEDMAWIMDINFWGVVHGTRAFLPHLIASGHGQLANVSSLFGLIAAPKDSAYNASKFAVRGFTESIRQELRIERRPVSVSCIHPGGIKTAIARTARVAAGDDPAAVTALFDRVALTTPESAARTIISGLRRERSRILVGPDAWLIAALPRLLGAHYSLAVETGARLLSV
ncbi:putative oxidoreductase SadH [Nocardia cerradoensis]|uniref:Putative oxidoreductase SadH n=1 Tax=Nocardia cerradoensis TaxID=85688 RepID=A0A231GTG8_9NOCA|nr:SDR family NAD(P)-dependent oxidoreductase [Nocardia cerradoensis]OXR39771.1 putative oxidoreductase SadH [Nocardia cerradoensis]